MAQKYLSQFYTFKGIQLRDGREVAEPETPLELQIQSCIQCGHMWFFQGKYARALKFYLYAWGLLPKLVYEFFPEFVARINDTKLLALDLERHLLETSVEILRFRDVVGPDVPITCPIDPPGELVNISEEIGGKVDVARQSYRRGTMFMQMGDFKAARRNMDKVLECCCNKEPELEADARAILGVIKMGEGKHNAAIKELEKAGHLYTEMKKTDGMAAMQHNMGVSYTLKGDFQQAGKYFAASVSNSPGIGNWQITQTVNPGIASVTRPAGKVGLPFLVKNYEGKWVEFQGNSFIRAKNQVNVIRDNAALQIGLSGNVSAQIEAELLGPRVEATTLAALDLHLSYAYQFVSYLSHIRGFVLPLALGDIYFALGDYEKAAVYYKNVRDYKYLNHAIERPMVWRKLASTYLKWGNRLYRDRDMAGAQAKYEYIAVIKEDGFDLTGPLYSGGFAALTTETMNFLNAPDPLAFTSMDYARRIIIMEVLANLRQIMAGINYLGFPEDIIPIHSWRYLQNVARYFANQAIQAERAYISFKDTAEQEEFTRLALEQAVDAQTAALEVENRRVAASKEQRRVANLSAHLAQTRLDNAEAQKTDYDSVSEQLVYYDEIIAFTNASGIRDVRIVIKENWADALGIDAKKYKPNELIQILTHKRSQLTRQYELRNMQRKIDEITDAKAVADAQVDVADKMVEVAEAQRDLAELRQQQAQAQLEYFNAQEFTPELWNNLAQAQQDISRRYLDWAIGAAFLMERAFELEYDTEVNRIRFDYERSELHGLLSADFLLTDIDRFSYDRLLETEKQVPVKVVISLADRYPFQFCHQFQETGRIDFETFLDDFDQQHPGAHLRKLRRVEVVIEGLVGSQGLHGTLTNSGISYFRDRNGKRKIRIQKPETLVLSRFELRNDGFIFTYDEDLLAVFENSGVASGWILEFPPSSNDIDYRGITNIHLVFYFDPYYSEHVANVVRAELAAAAVYQHTLGLGLRFQYPDEFFGFQDTGEVTFTVDNAYLPFDHTDPRISDIYILIETDEGTSPASLVVEVSSSGSGLTISDTTDVNGMISTDTAAVPLNGLRTTSLMDSWTIRIPEAGNEAAFTAGFTWEKVSNIFLFAEYDYTPRGRAAVSDAFSADPLPDFDVVDDSGAASSAPSNWTYDAANQLVRQTSNIYGGAGGTSPDKPGTYLVRKTSTEWPDQRDLVLRCRLNSGDDDGIGMIFRYQDEDNFYFFLMDAQRNYRRLGKKQAGVFRELETAAVDTTSGYTLNQDYELTIAAVGDAFKVYLDDVEILEGRDRSIQEPGRVGFYAWGNTGARFHNLFVQPA